MNDFDEMPTMNVIHLIALKDNEIFDLKNALGWYADKKNWNLGVSISMGSAFPLHEAIKSDKGKIARQALKGNQ